MSKVKCQNLGISLIEMIVVIAIGVVLYNGHNFFFFI